METMSQEQAETEWMQILNRANEMERVAKNQLKFIVEMKQILLKSRTGSSPDEYHSRCSRA